MTNGLLFLVFFVAVVVIANLLVGRRNAARQGTTAEFARLRGLVPCGNENPFLGTYAPLPPPAGIGISPPRPYLLEALASGRGTVQNVLRSSTPAGEVLLLDFRMPPEGSGTSRHRFSTLAAFQVPEVPTFMLSPRPRFSIGMKFLTFAEAPAFSKRFAVAPAEEEEVRRIFTPEVLAACEALPADKEWQLSAGGGWLFATFGLARPNDLGVLLDAIGQLASALRSSSRAASAGAP